MATSVFSSLGDLHSGYSKCRKEGYGKATCAVASAAGLATQAAAVGVATVTLPVDPVAGAAMAYNSGSFGELAAEIVKKKMGATPSASSAPSSAAPSAPSAAPEAKAPEAKAPEATYKEIRTQTISVFADMTDILEKQSAAERRANLSHIQASLQTLQQTALLHGYADIGKVLHVGNSLVGAAQGYEMLNMAQGLTMANFAGTLGMVTSAFSIASSLFGSEKEDNGLGAALQGIASMIQQGFTIVMGRLDALEKTITDRFDTLESKLDKQHYETYRAILNVRIDGQVLLNTTKYEFKRAEERVEALRYDISSMRATLDSCTNLLSDSLASLRHEAFENLIREVCYDLMNERLTEEKAHSYLARLDGAFQTIAKNGFLTGVKGNISVIPDSDTDPFNYIGMYAEQEDVGNPILVSIIYRLTKLLNSILPHVSSHNQTMMATQATEIQRLPSLTFRNPVSKVDLDEAKRIELEAVAARQKELATAVHALSKKYKEKMMSVLKEIQEQKDFMYGYTELALEILYFRIPSWLGGEAKAHRSQMSGSTFYEELTGPGSQIHTNTRRIIKPSLTVEEFTEIREIHRKRCIENGHAELAEQDYFNPPKHFVHNPSITIAQCDAAWQTLSKNPSWAQEYLKSLLPKYLQTLEGKETVCLKATYKKAKLVIPIQVNPEIITKLANSGYYMWFEVDVTASIIETKIKHVITGEIISTTNSSVSYSPNTNIPLTDMEHLYQALFGTIKTTHIMYGYYIKANATDGFFSTLESSGKDAITEIALLPEHEKQESCIASYIGWYKLAQSFEDACKREEDKIHSDIHRNHPIISEMIKGHHLWMGHERKIQQLKEKIAGYC